MAHPDSDLIQDVMQVCLNGHVITDLAGAHPERRRTACDRCGAATIDRCPTCGTALPGAVAAPGLATVGTRRPPRCCSVCGAALPWARQSRPAAGDPTAPLERLLRRLPRVVRQLRWRQGDRPPFRVEDERDLEDLLRALLPLHFDDVRPEGRTPRYAAGVRTDFRLVPGADRRCGQGGAAARRRRPADGTAARRRGLLPRPPRLPHSRRLDL